MLQIETRTPSSAANYQLGCGEMKGELMNEKKICVSGAAVPVCVRGEREIGRGATSIKVCEKKK